jgi:hypothetical protein
MANRLSKVMKPGKDAECWPERRNDGVKVEIEAGVTSGIQWNNVCGPPPIL